MTQERSQAPEAPECHPSPGDGKAAAFCPKCGPFLQTRPLRRATIKHGTRTGYQYGCSCGCCLGAHREYEKIKRWGLEPPRLVDARPVRQRLLALEKRGYGPNQLSRLYPSVAIATLSKIRAGKFPTCQRRVADVILAMDPQTHADGSPVDARPMHKLADELEERGYSLDWISHAVRYWGLKRCNRRLVCRADTFRRVCAELQRIQRGEIRR